MRATAAAAHALRLDPDLGEAHCTMGYLKALSELAWEEAEHEFKRALELSPGSADTYDPYRRLCAELERAVSLSPQSTMWLAQLGQAYGMAGDAAKARAILRTLEERAKEVYVSPYHFAYRIPDFARCLCR